MKKSKALILLVFFSSFIVNISLSHSLKPADFTLKFWSGGLRIWVSYPEDASPGDTISYEVYILSSKFARGNNVEQLKITVTVPLSDSTTVNLYENILVQNQYMRYGDEMNTTITVQIPSNALWYTAMGFDVVSYDFDNSVREESHVILDSTRVLDRTYSDLESISEELNLALSNMVSDYNELMAYIDTLNQSISGSSDCTQLQAKYNEVLLQLLNVTEQYNLLLIQCEGTENVEECPEDTDLIKAFNDLSNMFNQLEEEHGIVMEEFEARSAELEESKEHVSLLVEELEDRNVEVESLNVEISRLNEENEMFARELGDCSEAEEQAGEAYEELYTKIRAANNLRNLLVAITAVSIGTTVFIYIKKDSL